MPQSPPGEVETIPDVSPEIPTTTWRVVLAMLGQLPARAMSRSFGRIADINLSPRWREKVLGSFARAVGVDLAEAELPLGSYPSLNAFFVRKLRSDARNWPPDASTIASPVDGVVGRFGTVMQGMAIQAKGHSYSVADLLGDKEEARRFDGGSFLTIYLSPRHYHRIHTPAAGTIARATYLPGSLYPVNAPAVMHIPHLFARNERLITYIDSASGRIPVVAVGAYNVGRISASFDPGWSGHDIERWVSNRAVQAPLQRQYQPPVEVPIGAEIMVFHLGSTVVLLFEPGVRLSSSLESGREVKAGEVLGTGPGAADTL